MKKIGIATLFIWVALNCYAPNPFEGNKEELKRLEKLLEEKQKERELERFLHDLALKESGNNPRQIKNWGYSGMYQFSDRTLKGVGYSHITYRKFRANPGIWDEEEQTKAAIRLMEINKERLEWIISEYEGTKIMGVEISLSGILAGAHLGGSGSVSAYFLEGENRKDRLGTSVEEYMVFFSGYNI